MGHSPAEERLSALKRLRSALDQLKLPAGPPRSLTIGCGTFPSYSSLLDIRPDWLHAGLDFDAAALRPAKHRPVIVADGSTLPFGVEFALILIRHPDVALHGEGWKAIFQQAGGYLAPGGLLLVTVYNLEERDFVRQHVSLPPYHLNETTLAALDLSGEDHYVLVFHT